MKSKECSIDDLRWVRLFTSAHIPTYLVDQIVNRSFEKKAFFDHLDRNMLRSSGGEVVLNKMFHVWSLVNPDNLVEGFLWGVIDPLTKDMFIQTFSVSSTYWNKGIVGKLATHVKWMKKYAELKKIFWVTDKPKHSEKHGFTRSKSILMEYSEINGED